MTEFALVHRGVPIGAAATNPFFDRPPAVGPAPQLGEPIHLDFLEFRPLAAYEVLAPALQLAERAFSNLGFLGPAADPASDAAGKAAHAAAESIWREIELVDSAGAPVSGRVVWFLDAPRRPEQRFWLHVELDDAAAPVPAALPRAPRGGSAHEPPAP
jgi:hypothetical protein